MGAVENRRWANAGLRTGKSKKPGATAFRLFPLSLYSAHGATSQATQWPTFRFSLATQSPTLIGATLDPRPSPQRLTFAAHPVVAGRAESALRDQTLRARPKDDARAAGTQAHSSARQVAGDRRWRTGTGRVGGDHRVPCRPLRWRAPVAGRRYTRATALHLLAALRRRLGDAAAVAETGVPARGNDACTVLHQTGIARCLGQGTSWLRRSP